MDITGTCSNGKERLLTQDYNLSLPQYNGPPRRLRFEDLLNRFFAILSVVACIVSITCTVYCIKASVEVKTLQNPVTIVRSGITAPLVATTEASDLYQTETDTSVEADLDYEEYFTDDESETDEYDGEDLEDDEDYEDNFDYEEGGSGEVVRTGEEHARERRDANRCTDKCKKKTGNKYKRCMRKCQKGGKKMPSTNLRAAHFEARFSDVEIKDLVRKDFNSYINKEFCQYSEKLEGTICSDRKFYPTSHDGILRIFKPASWVKSDQSPVKFNNSIALATTAGVYFVYAQVNIGGRESGKSIAITQKRNGAEINYLSCNNGLHGDHINSTYGLMQTCSVSGLMHLMKGDSIFIQKTRQTQEIVLDVSKTYFGVVQLS